MAGRVDHAPHVQLQTNEHAFDWDLVGQKYTSLSEKKKHILLPLKVEMGKVCELLYFFGEKIEETTSSETIHDFQNCSCILV